MTHLSEKFRKDYQAPNYFVDEVYLTFTLDPKETLVETTLKLRKNMQTQDLDFCLNGSPTLKLLAFSLDNHPIDLSSLKREGNDLYLAALPEHCTIALKNSINPQANKALEGLYLSQGLYCSDCEPEGFRSITFYPDRPDIMAKYTVKIIADQPYSALLSNGNLIETGMTEGRPFALWHDPFPKPSYLFALVAGELSYIEDQHIRPNGRAVTLRIYAENRFIDQCHYALGALKRAMEWDETRFGLVCDLDFYNIVAVQDFNGGAMENKGLNIFNAKYVLADEHTATDEDFETIESIIGHEYFHNWTGNRVTCRDWFQLSLKEGLTVFRDQEFTSDLRHRGLKRIDDVKLLRAHQFTEDAGSLSHPIRPDSYVEMRNFYTATVYEKGAEVVRLYQTLLGTTGFNKGLAHYLNQFDGQAATCADFLAAMEGANATLLPNFDRWYSQAGTPTVRVKETFNQNRLTLDFTQVLTNTAKHPNKQPQIIPINLALIDDRGQCLLEQTVVLKEFTTSITFDDLKAQPVVSYLRNFSAPIILEGMQSDAQLLTIVRHESDDFSRWEALQKLLTNIVLSQRSIKEKQQQTVEIFTALVSQAADNPALFARLLKLPEASFMAEFMPSYDLLVVQGIKKALEQHLALSLAQVWRLLYTTHNQNNAAARALKNCALSYLAQLPESETLLTRQFTQALNMTDKMAALTASIRYNRSSQSELLNQFITTYGAYPAVIDKWFSVQASNPKVSLQTLSTLVAHPLFSFENPNRVRSVLAAYGQNRIALLSNPEQNYAWLLDNIILLDSINPQGSARLAAPFAQMQKLPQAIQTQIHALMTKALQQPLSKNLTEQLNRSLP